MRAFAFLVLLGLVAGCTSNDATPPASDPDATPTPPTSPPAVAVEVALHNDPGVGVPPTTMGIDPQQLELALGVPVNLTVVNRGTGQHDLVIDGLGVDTDNIPPGESLTVEFTPMEEGTFTMYCSIGGDSPAGHRGQGMVGEVVVA